jgi:hypothetical protein
MKLNGWRLQMKNKLLAVMIIFIIPLLACSESTSPAQSNLITELANLKAKVPIWDSYGPRLTAVEARPTGGGTTFDPQSLKDKDTDLQGQITQLKKDLASLKDDQTWINKTTSTGGSTGTPKGDVLSTNGDLELFLEKDMDEELYIDDNSAKSFFLSVRNNGASGSYYRINANFDLAGDVSTIALIEPTALSCENSSMLTMARSTTIPGTVSGLAFVSQQSGGGTKIWIGKNSTVDLILVLKINYTDPVVNGKLWTWDFSIRQLN